MKGSNGIRRRTRNLKKNQREKGKVKIREYLQEFSEGETVSISINPSFQAIPHPRFQGKSGKIIGMQGRSYLINLRDGGVKKNIIVQPEHLKPMK